MDLSFLHIVRFFLTGFILFSALSASPQEELPDFYRIHRDLQQMKPLNGKYSFIFDDSTMCSVQFENSLISGSWRSYYKNNKRKAKGNFTQNKATGMWQTFSPSGRRFVLFDYGCDELFKIRRVRYGLFHNPVRRGNGSVTMTLYGTVEVDSASAYSAVVPYRRGLRHGHVAEYYLNGEKRADYNYNEGRYHGRFFYFGSSGLKKLEAEYRMGIPTGKWIYYYANKQSPVVEDFTAEPYKQRVPGRGFVNEREVLFRQKFFKVIHSSDSLNAELFEPDSAGISLFSIFRDAYIAGETEFYQDMNLNEHIMPSMLRPNISGLDIAAEFKLNPVMLFYSDFFYFSLQLSDVRNMVLVMSLICSYEDADGGEQLISLPFVYFPETYNDLKDKMLHGKTFGDIFLGILEQQYTSYPVYVSNVYGRYLYEYSDDEGWIMDGIRKRLELFNITHDLRMYQTGVLR